VHWTAFEGFGVLYSGDTSYEHSSRSLNPIFSVNNGKPLTMCYMLHYYITTDRSFLTPQSLQTFQSTITCHPITRRSTASATDRQPRSINFETLRNASKAQWAPVLPHINYTRNLTSDIKRRMARLPGFDPSTSVSPVKFPFHQLHRTNERRGADKHFGFSYSLNINNDDYSGEREKTRSNPEIRTHSQSSNRLVPQYRNISTSPAQQTAAFQTRSFGPSDAKPAMPLGQQPAYSTRNVQ
jgi:hypothetical protein